MQAARIHRFGAPEVIVVEETLLTLGSDVPGVVEELGAGVVSGLEIGDGVRRVGNVLPLADVRAAHEMLAGAPHRRGKIVLRARDAP